MKFFQIPRREKIMTKMAQHNKILLKVLKIKILLMDNFMDLTVEEGKEIIRLICKTSKQFSKIYSVITLVGQIKRIKKKIIILLINHQKILL